ncbi:cytochrome P450, partial [Diplogelasinospora grovesii]
MTEALVSPAFTMNMGITNLLLLSTICLCLTIVYTLLPPHKRTLPFRKPYKLPPGPQGHPVLGSLLSWLKARNSGQLVPWLVTQSQYGEMTTLSMGTKTWVLLNTSRVVNEMIAKRASMTHERPYFPIAGGLVSRGNKRLFLQKTEDWREGRRLIHSLMMSPSTSSTHPQIIESSSLGLLKSYLDHPDRWYAHHYRYAVDIMHQIVTGAPLTAPASDLEQLQRVTSSFLTSINSSFAEFFPQLNALPEPLQIWRKHWEDMGTYHYQTFQRWWKSMLINTTPTDRDRPSSSWLRDTVLKDFAGREERAMYLVLLVIVAGADNPRMATNAFVMACLSRPAAIARARAELDSVCSISNRRRLPTLHDLPNCPYTCAVVKEVLRWRNVVPLIPQRVAVEDIEFEGYRFPAGTEFLVNSVAVCGNPQDYDRAAEFRPERWLQTKGKTGKEEEEGSAGGGGGGDGAGVEQDLWQFAFSGGRRMCVGYKLAQKELFIAFARLLYCFDFTPGGEFDDTRLNAFSPGEPFPVKVTVRSTEHERLIRQAT